jgi:endoglucanase
MNTFRVAFLMERLVPNQMTGGFDAAYLADLKSTVAHITGKGAYAVIDPHNYMRYYGNVITDVNAFQTWWKNVASVFSGNPNVIFDCNNEPHDMPSMDLVVQLDQACINGIRSAGATSQYIFVEGTSWSGAWSW